MTQPAKTSMEKMQESLMYGFFMNGEPVILSMEDEKFVHTSIDTFREFFKENEIAFELSTRGVDSKVIHFKMLVQNELVDILVTIFLKHKMCSIVFKLPFKVNDAMEAQLYRVLMGYNSTRRFGAFIYDNGEIDYKTDFPCADGVKKEDFVAAFIISMNSIRNFMGELKKYVVPVQ